MFTKLCTVGDKNFSEPDNVSQKHTKKDKGIHSTCEIKINITDKVN